MKKLRLLLSGIVCAGIMSSVPIQAGIIIQYKQQREEGKKPEIEKVLFSDGKNEDWPISPIAFDRIITNHQKKIIENKDYYFKKWKQYSLAQLATFGTVGALFATNYINENPVAAFKRRDAVKNILQKLQAVGPIKLKVAAFAALTGLALYPLRYANTFSDVDEINFCYPGERVDNRIVVLRKRYISHYIYTRNGAEPVYALTSPIGYMTVDEYEKEFAVVFEANRRKHFTICTSILYAAGLFWAAVI